MYLGRLLLFQGRLVLEGVLVALTAKMVIELTLSTHFDTARTVLLRRTFSGKSLVVLVLGAEEVGVSRLGGVEVDTAESTPRAVHFLEVRVPLLGVATLSDGSGFAEDAVANGLAPMRKTEARLDGGRSRCNRLRTRG